MGFAEWMENRANDGYCVTCGAAGECDCADLELMREHYAEHIAEDADALIEHGGLA